MFLNLSIDFVVTIQETSSPMTTKNCDLKNALLNFFLNFSQSIHKKVNYP